MKMFRRTLKVVGVAALACVVGLLGVGDYVYRTGTKVFCGIHPDHADNTPSRFETPAHYLSSIIT